MNPFGRSFSRMVRTVGLLAGLVVLCACVSQPSSTEQIPVPTETVEAPTPTMGASPTLAGSAEKVPTPIPTIVKEESEVTPTASVSQGLQRFVDLAVTDLAQRLGVEADEIEVVEVDEVVWPDGSLGCPQPGMRYIQVLQDGLLIRLSDGKRAYDYHSGGSRDPFLCEQAKGSQDLTATPTLPGSINQEQKVIDITSVPTPSDASMQRLVGQAKADLARRLSISEDQIELIKAIRVDWPDSSMGCPEPGGEYLHVWVVGELIQLRADGRLYEYHSGPNRPPFLCQPSK